MKCKLIAAMVAASGLGAVFPAMAEDTYQGAWYLLPSLGVMHTDSDLKADDDNLAYGMRAGKEISEHWDIQLGLNHSRADGDGNGYSGGRYRQTLLGADALYFLSRDTFRPFVLAGLGVAHNSIHYNGIAPTPSADGSHNSWMANVGVGAQYLVSDNIGIQAEIRQVFSRAKADGGLFGSDQHETIGNTYLNLGVVFRFGSPSRYPVAVAASEMAAPLEARQPESLKDAEQMASPAPEPEPMGSGEAAFDKVTIQAEVLFDFNKAIVKPAGKKTLDEQVVEKMKANPQVELLLITGHADHIGSDQFNQHLSESRAHSVQAYLVSQGIAASRLHTVGRGETQAVVECTQAHRSKLIECLQPNRRVVLEIETQRATPK